MSQMLSSKRATRGQRMTALIGEAVEQDEAFWGADVWESDDESFSEEEVEPDIFDSDFNDTEDEGGSDDEDGEKEAVDAGRKERTSSNRYREPGGPRVKKPLTTASSSSSSRSAAGDDNGEIEDGEGTTVVAPVIRKKKIQRVDSQESGISGPRAMRESTKVKTEVADINRKRAAEEAFRTKVKFRPPLKHQFTQKELLMDALNTETDNQKWLEVQRLQDYERALGDKIVKPANAERFIRFVSRRGAPNTVTFSHTDLVPAIFGMQQAETAENIGMDGDGEDEEGEEEEGERM